jgi:hypothetical protein
VLTNNVATKTDLLETVKNSQLIRWLNFHEAEILQGLFANPSNARHWNEHDGECWLISLQILVIDPRRPDCVQQHRHITMGFALVQRQTRSQGPDQSILTLIYFRIQDHLRNMGLTRRALQQILELGALDVQQCALGLHDRGAEYSDADRRNFTRLFYSAARTGTR